MKLRIRNESRRGFGLREVALRGFTVGIVGLGLFIGGQSAALASAGCAAFNGSFNGGNLSGNVVGTTFAAGDIITMTVTAAAGGDTLGLINFTKFTAILFDTGAVGTRTYAVPADTSDTFAVSGGFGGLSNFTWSCVAGGGATGGATDSQKLDNVQTIGTTIASTTSARNITDSVGGAIDEALGGSTGHRAHLLQESLGSQSTKDDYFGRLPFAPEQRSTVAHRADEAFAALGYAAASKAPAGRAAMIAPQWTPWIDVRGTGFEQSNSSDLKGAQINATAGLTYRFRSDLVAGVYAGYENFKYDFAALNGSLKGNGGSVGTYAGWQITPTLRWKGMVGWTGVSYDGSAGTASGGFSGSRWIVSTGLTGNYRVSSVIVEPSASIFALTERQTGYTDSLAVVHNARNFSSGRVSLGGKVSAAQGLFTGFTPYVGLYGDWGFMSNSAVPVNVSSTGLGSGWSARTTAGVSIPVFARSTLALGGEYGGIGASYKAWTGNARLSVPF